MKRYKDAFVTFVAAMVMLFALALVVFRTTASAESVTTTTRIGYSTNVLEVGEFSPDKPTLLFFGGKQDRDSTKKTYRLIEDVQQLERWNVICVAIRNDPESKPISIWRHVADDLKSYIESCVAEGRINPKMIWIDGYSNGGAGAYYTTLALQQMPVRLPNGDATMVEVQKMTLIDGTLEGIIKDAQVQEILGMGVQLTLYVAAKTSYSLSAHGRDLVSRYTGTDGFTGILVDHSHGSGIVALTYADGYGNHRYDGIETL